MHDCHGPGVVSGVLRDRGSRGVPHLALDETEALEYGVGGLSDREAHRSP